MDEGREELFKMRPNGSNAWLFLKQVVLCTLGDVMAHLVLKTIQCLCQTRCLKVQVFSVHIIFGPKILEFWVFLLPPITWRFGQISGAQLRLAWMHYPNVGQGLCPWLFVTNRHLWVKSTRFVASISTVVSGRDMVVLVGLMTLVFIPSRAFWTRTFCWFSHTAGLCRTFCVANRYFSLWKYFCRSWPFVPPRINPSFLIRCMRPLRRRRRRCWAFVVQ